MTAVLEERPLAAHTVIYTLPGDAQWKFFHCDAVDADDAEDKCLTAHPTAYVCWANFGHRTYMHDESAERPRVVRSLADDTEGGSCD